MSETDLVYFITLCHESQAYRAELEKDHEPDEVQTQMIYAEKMIASRARLKIYNDFFVNNGYSACGQLHFREFDKYTQSTMLFDAIEYARNVNKDCFKKFDMELYINAFVKYYGKPATLSEVILKAAIRNDIELEKTLRKYL